MRGAEQILEGCDLEVEVESAGGAIPAETAADEVGISASLLTLPEGPGLSSVSFRVRGKKPEKGSEPLVDGDDGAGVGEMPPAPPVAEEP